MMKLIISLNLMFFSTLMYFMNHPLAMGMILLLQTILIMLMSGLIMKTFWFSYILFLVFLGGMLVMFIYVCSLASNEMFKFSFNMIIFSLINLISIFFIAYFMNKLTLLNNYFNMDMNLFMNKFMFFNNENNMNISKIYNNQSYYLTILLILYLLISLFAMIKIINIKQGPLRKIN